MSRHQNIGAPPGTMHYSGAHEGKRIKITLIEFNDADFFEQDFLSKTTYEFISNLTAFALLI